MRCCRDRVMGLASVYRALFKEPSVANVRMDALLEELLGQIVVSGSGAQARLSIERELEPIRLLPDQAGALAMLTAEALVYLFRHGTPDAEGRTRLRVRLYRDAPEPGRSDDGQICLFVTDTGVREGQTEMTGADRADPVGDLGTKLISAFAMQLNTQAERIADGEGLRIKVCFDADPV